MTLTIASTVVAGYCIGLVCVDPLPSGGGGGPSDPDVINLSASAKKVKVKTYWNLVAKSGTKPDKFVFQIKDGVSRTNIYRLWGECPVL